MWAISSPGDIFTPPSSGEYDRVPFSISKLGSVRVVRVGLIDTDRSLGPDDLIYPRL
ncbi:hypothetical protein [Vreelandella nanhaiensis]|uniref:hypothetical protein n=1 Tax=Vreelandella nanhaiensis TaxID=1258546 RepID=UPI001FE5709F|nr:hypothetical protein [Halomonas nanhaiensis]